jgi:hypothetical protein
MAAPQQQQQQHSDPNNNRKRGKGHPLEYCVRFNAFPVQNPEASFSRKSFNPAFQKTSHKKMLVFRIAGIVVTIFSPFLKQSTMSSGCRFNVEF